MSIIFTIWLCTYAAAVINWVVAAARWTYHK